ncbi:MAG: hypothetical protein AB7J35_08890 [Dehalococcoidia bacterium]
MKGFLTVIGTIFAAIMQVTVAPLFPVSGVVFDFVLLTLVLTVAFGSPKRAMVCVPVAALAYGFLSDREPGLLVLAYMPLLPLGLYLEEVNVPLNHYARTALAMGLTGAWARSLLVLGTVVGGAHEPISVILADVIVPGILLDLSLLTVVYVPLRLLGWSGQGMSLSRGGYYSSL